MVLHFVLINNDKNIMISISIKEKTGEEPIQKSIHRLEETTLRSETIISISNHEISLLISTLIAEKGISVLQFRNGLWQ
jgi:late competence protein required for DNA uptake (superfamily II DNA/RNA helicase)